MKKHLLVLLCTLALAVGIPALTYAAPPALNLSEQDKADLQRATDYLNALTRAKARILQLNPDGSVIGGTLQLKRPGKLRLEYDKPAGSFIVADGKMVSYWDDSLQSTSAVPQSESPAALILAAQVSFYDGMTVTEIVRDKKTLEISMYKTDDAGNGILTLVFEEDPFILKQWRVRDAQSAVTVITLQQVDTSPQFEDNVFTYTPPTFGTQKK